MALTQAHADERAAEARHLAEALHASMEERTALSSRLLATEAEVEGAHQASAAAQREKVEWAAAAQREKAEWAAAVQAAEEKAEAVRLEAAEAVRQTEAHAAALSAALLAARADAASAQADAAAAQQQVVERSEELQHMQACSASAKHELACSSQAVELLTAELLNADSSLHERDRTMRQAEAEAAEMRAANESEAAAASVQLSAASEELKLARAKAEDTGAAMALTQAHADERAAEARHLTEALHASMEERAALSSRLLATEAEVEGAHQAAAAAQREKEEWAAAAREETEEWAAVARQEKEESRMALSVASRELHAIEAQVASNLELLAARMSWQHADS